MARYQTANDLINRVLAETGLAPVTDPYASADPAIQQLTYLLNTAGQELIEEYPWANLVRSEQFITQAGDSGKYDLPDDFAYMIDQTGWERAANVPLFGPLSAQQWTYLLGRDLVNYTIYASFRLADNQFWLFPQPPAAGLDINYEYISRNWVKAGNQADTFRDHVEVGSDLPLYPPILISRLLKLRFLQAREPDWVGQPFFAKYDENATWLDELEPAFGERSFFFEPELWRRVRSQRPRLAEADDNNVHDTPGRFSASI